MTATSPSTAWPRYDGPDDLAAIEAVPLSERDLPESTYALLQQAGARFPSRPAVTLLPSAARWAEPVTWTFAELLTRVHRIGNALSTLGVGRLDAVALLSPNTGEVLAATLAAEAVGVAAPVNPGLAASQIRSLLQASGAKVLIAAGPELDPDLWDTALGLASDLGLAAVLAVRPDGAAPGRPALPGNAAWLEDLAAIAEPSTLLADPPVATDIAGYFHTGGSTGTPKIAVHTHANEVTMAWTLAACSGDEDIVLLGALPLFHANALFVTGLAPLFKGQQVVWAGPLGYRDPALYPAFWRIVERYRIGAMSAVPTVYAVLVHIPVDADISTLTLPIVGAAPLPDSVRTQFRDHTGVELCEGYGLTEATCASVRSFPGAPRPGTVGQRMPYQQIKAVRMDDNGWTDLPAGEPGVLVVSGPNVFPGYLRQTAAGRIPDPAGKVVDGWLDTGDLGSVDTAGFVRLTGRAKDLIIRGGHNIDPAGIEDALLTHPAVSSAAAVGRPDRHAGEVPVVYVTLHTETSPEELLTWAAEHVPERAAVPKDVYVVKEIPLTAVGKQYKPALRQDALRRAAEHEIASLDLAGVTATVVVDGDEPVVVVDPGTHQAGIGELALALDAYTFRWRLLER
ncbi:acyl-CoA synthetase [Actinocrispum wychmicini]|uniref:Fatty-acyl-CoA synthase n=1 Tax=Actinocrispum wychmicini TaxID=1213861 RepID=A0A4R2JTD1_9PSEU|nr:acyl-CoA synthetase [Actinocrispum wychmicini]TCO62232.1 fatty-acyl-CoA synthase [Actinocrispum wychmicini]